MRTVVIARGLANPCGVAIQPGTGHVFVSTPGRIIRITPEKAFAVSDEVVGFPRDHFGRGPVFEVGPLGLAFLSDETLIVGGGGLLDGEELVRFYDVGTEPKPKGQALDVAEMRHHSDPLPACEESKRGEGNFFGLAVGASSIFVTCNGDDTKGWIAKIEIDDGPGPLTPFIQSKVLTELDAPGGATMSPDGQLLVTQIGELNPWPDALLVFYDPKTGQLEKMLETGLRDLTAVAYHPTTGALYGVDFSWAEPAEGGLFRIDIVGSRVKTKKIASLVHPTAMAFDAKGNLYIAVIGEPAEDDGAKTGQVVRIEGL